MIQITVGDLLDDKTDELENYCIYVVRDGETVFYVGESARGVVNRLLDHLGLGLMAVLPSVLGETVFCNLPQARAWRIDLYTLEDCTPFVNEQFPAYKRWGIKEAEQALIAKLRPCLNTAHNPTPSALPECYKSDRTEATKRKAAGRLHLPYRRRVLRE